MNTLFKYLCLLLVVVGVNVNSQENDLNCKKVIILLGPPGSGKGTQAVKVSKVLDIPHISTGDLFRDNLSRNTELGIQVKSYMETGKLVPDELVLDMLFDRLSRPDSQNGYLLDGFPRTLPQAEAFAKKLNHSLPLIVLNLTIADESIMKRMAGRLTCKQCGNIHNQYFSPPQEIGKCDRCHGELYQRSDDNPSVVQERLRVYHEQTKPLIEFYKKQNLLMDIDGEQSPEKVFSEIETILKCKKTI